MASNYFNNNRILKGTSIPVSGNFEKGDIVVNIGPDASDCPMWICTEAGDPGSWDILFGDIKMPEPDESLNQTHSTTKGVCEFESDGNEYIELMSSIEGKTLKNMFPKVSKSTEDWYMDNESLVAFEANTGFVTITAHANGYYVDYTAKNVNEFKTDTEYTLFLEVLSNTLVTTQTSSLRIGGNTTNGVFTSNYYLPVNGTGRYKKLMKTRTDISDAVYAVETVLMAATSGSIKFRMMLIEGNHMDKEMHYFQGLKSIGDDGNEGIELYVVADEVDLSGITWTDGAYINAATGATVTDSRYSYSNEYIEIDSSRKYFSRYINRHVVYYDKDKNHIPTQALQNERVRVMAFGVCLEFFPPENAKYIKLVVEKANKNAELYGKYRKIVIPGVYRSLPNGVCDHLEKRGGKFYSLQRCTSYTTSQCADFRFNVDQSNDTTLLTYITLALADSVNNNSDDDNLYADRMMNSMIWNNTITTEGVYKSKGKNLYMRIFKSRFTNFELLGMRDWLKANPITVVYELDRTVINEIPNISLQTFEGTNKVILNTGIFQTDIDFKVVKSIGNAIEQIEEKIDGIDSVFDRITQTELEIEKLEDMVRNTMQNKMLTENSGFVTVRDKDFNFLTETGWYYVVNPLNGPMQGNAGAWFVEVIGLSNGYVHQKVIRNLNYDNEVMQKYERFCYAYKWGNWINTYEKIPADAVTVPQWYGDRWGTCTNISYSREQLAGAIVDNCIYCMGGYSGTGSNGTTNNQCYDAKTNKWTTKTVLPKALLDSAAASVGTNIYLMGGRTTTDSSSSVNTNYCFDTLTNTWTTKTAMPSVRHYCTASNVYDQIYVIGGTGATEDGNYKINYCYNPSTNTWSTKASAPYNRTFSTEAVVNRKIYLFGAGTSSVATKTICYDPMTNTWSTKKDMPTVRRGAGAAAIGNDIYVMCGFDNLTNDSSDQALTVNECYNTTNDTWTTMTACNIATQCFVTEVYNGVIYLMGGYTKSGSMNSAVRYYLPK